MSGRGRILALMVVVVVVGSISCDRKPVALPPSTAPAQPALELELKPLTPLLPNRPTHIAVDPLGNIYWSQEIDRADDTMFVIGEGDIPRATQLSVANIAAAMNASGGKGNIQDIATAAASGGEIFFFYNGVLGRRTLACFGVYSPRTAQIRVLADTDALAAATGKGRSLSLARGTIIADERNVWVWVRHSDAWAVFRVDPRLPTSGPVQLNKQFDVLKLGEQQQQQPIELTRDEYQMSAAPGGALFLLDPVAGRLMKITASGEASVVRSLVGLPIDLSTPAIDKSGQMLLFAANAELIKPRTADAAIKAQQLPTFDATFPALLIFAAAGDKVTHIGRDDMQAYPGFPVFGMRLRQLVAHPKNEAFISYDAGSGELLRVRVREKTLP
jgi:hypothetical protein